MVRLSEDDCEGEGKGDCKGGNEDEDLGKSEINNVVAIPLTILNIVRVFLFLSSLLKIRPAMFI